MAEYPGLPNWNYGLHVPAETLLQLIPGTPQRNAATAESAYKQSMAQAVPEQATTDRMRAEQGNWTELANVLARMDTYRQMDGTLPPDMQMMYDEVIRRMGMTPGPRGLPPAPEGPGGVTPGGLDAAKGEVSRGWLGKATDKASDVIAAPMAGLMSLFGGSRAPNEPQAPPEPRMTTTPGQVGLTSVVPQPYQDQLLKAVTDFLRIQPEKNVPPQEQIKRLGPMGPGAGGMGSLWGR